MTMAPNAENDKTTFGKWARLDAAKLQREL
jgi:hypothetical protein